MAGVFAGAESGPGGDESFREVQDFEQLTASGLDVLEAFAQWLHDRDARAELRTHQHAESVERPRICMCTVITRWVVYTITGDSMTAAVSHAARKVDDKLRELFAKTQPGTGPLEGGSSHVEG